MATDLAKGEGDVSVPINGPRVKGQLMKAAAWYGARHIRVIEVDRPAIAHPKDVILKVTSTAICGSDLHLYTGSFPRASMQRGDILGHEFMGMVHEIGEDVTGLKRGDRVVACFDIACGECESCQMGLFTACDTTNDSRAQEFMYGDKSGGFFGYSHLTGGWSGGQADYVRVPYAELNLLKLPPKEQLPDLDALLLSDVLSTAWHATEMGEVGPGDTVTIWGAGPVGILAAQCAQHRGASKVILIDQEQYRLDFAERRLDPHTLATINGRQEPVTETVRNMLPHGPDVCIEAVGFHYASSWMHKMEMAVGLETDPADVMNEIFLTARKGARISVVGVYLGYVNQFNFGAFMEKGLTMKAGQTPVQRYWEMLLKKVEDKELQPRIVITHEMPLDAAPEAYEIFNDKKDGCVKVVLHPRWYEEACTTGESAGEGEGEATMERAEPSL